MRGGVLEKRSGREVRRPAAPGCRRAVDRRRRIGGREEAGPGPRAQRQLERSPSLADERHIDDRKSLRSLLGTSIQTRGPPTLECAFPTAGEEADASYSKRRRARIVPHPRRQGERQCPLPHVTQLLCV